MKRLIFLKDKRGDFEKKINDLIQDQQYMVLDVTMMAWDRMQKLYYLGLLVEEQERFFRQNCLVLENRDPENITRDLDDFSEVMSKAKNVPYEITMVRTFKISTPRGERYFAYVFYRD